MKIIIENTDKIVNLNGVPVRIWEGQTDSGIKINAFIYRIAINNDETDSVINQFKTELQEQKPPNLII